MNNIQKSAFYAIVGQIVKRKPAYKHSGTRTLAKHEEELRRAVNLGLTHEEIADALQAIPNSPVNHLSASTIKQYVSACCAELNITRRQSSAF